MSFWCFKVEALARGSRIVHQTDAVVVCVALAHELQLGTILVDGEVQVLLCRARLQLVVARDVGHRRVLGEQRVHAIQCLSQTCHINLRVR